jgi:hypothetical protein
MKVILSGVKCQGENSSRKYLEFFKKALTPAIFCSSIHKRGLLMTIRQAINKELQRRGWSRYRLEKELEGKMPARTIYAYLSGECDLGSERVSIILQALDLQIKRKSKRGRRPRKEV